MGRIWDFPGLGTLMAPYSTVRSEEMLGYPRKLITKIIQDMKSKRNF